MFSLKGLNFSLVCMRLHPGRTKKVTTKMLCLGIFVGLVLESWSLPVQVRTAEFTLKNNGSFLAIDGFMKNIKLLWNLYFVLEFFIGSSDQAEVKERVLR